ncbi:hypothetical protein ATG98_0958 [Marinobacter sp. LV10R520-4]|uniref:ABC-three component system middle component 6 n=1 Tax=Marinobacter sp. LV10R520-4 TaxID=1761796 RepID=UPI000BF9FBD8|nr:ABC-three component system middle component 6 [Marinobacter sp. LV10R520-4]PFG51975.1 hypothetical protein ATG98_0958 [Marinobacter sp. LV10R520-4]
MLFPTKAIKPADSVFFIAAYLTEALSQGHDNFDSAFDYIQNTYPKTVTIELVILSFDFLFMLDRIEVKGDSFKIKLN